MNNGGLVLSHLGDAFPELFEGEAREAGCTLPELFGRYAGEIPPGSEGLIFLPCFTGERSRTGMRTHGVLYTAWEWNMAKSIW